MAKAHVHQNIMSKYKPPLEARGCHRCISSKLCLTKAKNTIQTIHLVTNVNKPRLSRTTVFQRPLKRTKRKKTASLSTCVKVDSMRCGTIMSLASVESALDQKKARKRAIIGLICRKISPLRYTLCHLLT